MSSNIRSSAQTTQPLRVPILTYHSIDETGSVISTAAKTFRQQMKYLNDASWNVISLDDLVFSLVNRTPALPKTVVLTFDDGFKNFYTEAFPVLEQYRFKATVFLVTDYCDRYNDWEGETKKITRNKLLSWQEIKELNRLGVVFGSHTRSHPDLRKISPDRVQQEMFGSRSAIEDALGCEVTTFAYPYGSYNTAVKQATEDAFKSACSTKLAKVQFGSDRFCLERVDSYYLSNEKFLPSLPSKSFDRYLKIRRFMRDFKSLISLK